MTTRSHPPLRRPTGRTGAPDAAGTVWSGSLRPSLAAALETT
jgi:hypothetical protein